MLQQNAFESGALFETEFLTDDSQLRLQTIVRLRWIGVIGQIFALCVVYFWLRFDLPIGPCLTIIAISAWLNVFLAIYYPARHRLSVAFATAPSVARRAAFFRCWRTYCSLVPPGFLMTRTPGWFRLSGVVKRSRADACATCAAR